MGEIFRWTPRCEQFQIKVGFYLEGKDKEVAKDVCRDTGGGEGD